MELINVEVLVDGQWISEQEPLTRDGALPYVEAFLSIGRAVRVRADGQVIFTSRPKLVLVQAQQAANDAADRNDLTSPDLLADGVTVEQAADWRVSYEAEQAAEAAEQARALAAAKAAYGQFTDRDPFIREVKRALKARSGRSWSVTGGRGTAWGWVDIRTAPGQRVCVEGIESGPCTCGKGADCGHWYMTESDRRQLGALLGLGRPAHHQGESIPAQHDYRLEYVQRANGVAVAAFGAPMWD